MASRELWTRPQSGNCEQILSFCPDCRGKAATANSVGAGVRRRARSGDRISNSEMLDLCVHERIRTDEGMRTWEEILPGVDRRSTWTCRGTTRRERGGDENLTFRHPQRDEAEGARRKSYRADRARRGGQSKHRVEVSRGKGNDRWMRERAMEVGQWSTIERIGIFWMTWID